MSIYQIADLLVEMNPFGQKLLKQADDYRYEKKPEDSVVPDIKIALTREFLTQKQKENPHLNAEDCDYIWSGFEFYRQLLNYEGFMLHSSAVMFEGYAYLFSAPCGTGKSTHARLWQCVFGDDKAKIINDDKPAIRLVNGKFIVYGTPFSGKTDQNMNVSAPLKAICILEQAKENHIKRISMQEAILPLLNQTYRPRDEIGMEQCLKLIDKLILTIPIYKMGCNISGEAAIIAYNTMSAES